MRHIHIPWLMAILLRKFMLHHQRRICYILPPWDLLMGQACICYISTEYLTTQGTGWISAQIDIRNHKAVVLWKVDYSYELPL